MLKWCASGARVRHLERTVEPETLEPFLAAFDELVRQTFCALLHGPTEDGAEIPNIPDPEWAITRRKVRDGGEQIRTGIDTSGAQYAQSVVATHKQVEMLAPGYDWRKILAEHTRNWLAERLPEFDNFEALLRNFFPAEYGGDPDLKPALSLSQSCEAEARNRAMERMTPLARQRIDLLSFGPKIGQHWPAAPARRDLGLVLDADEYRVAQRMRRGLAVLPNNAICTWCHSHGGLNRGEHPLCDEHGDMLPSALVSDIEYARTTRCAR